MVDPIINSIFIAAPATGNFLVDIILWLVKGTSSVALGVVLFTVILKVITLPFDFISRSSMRKNSLKMEEMRPELEKLQKQYADNKDLYNQKMMALYKKNGYSMFGSCLPTIITLVIFIVAINAFNDYSRFQNHEYFYDMTVSYNSVLYKGLQTDDEYIKIDENGVLIVDKDKILANATARTEDGKEKKFLSVGEGENTHEIIVEKLSVKQDTYPPEIEVISTTDSYVYYYETSKERELFVAKEKGLIELKLASEENNFLKDSEGNTFAEAKIKAEEKGEEDFSETKFLKELCEQRSADTFNNNGSSFLWVKNIWVTDSATAHPVESVTDFNNKNGHREGGSCSCNGKVTPIIADDDYKNLTAKLEDKKSAPNGYYIFVILTAGISLLTQLVMSKGQKAQMELQTVDGQGAQTQKMMMWMMPIMMAVFAFMYTAAFSIYIVLSSLISMLSTIVINKVVDSRFKKKKSDSDVIHSKKVIREAEEEKKAAEERKNKPKKKKEEPETGDFLSGEADKKKHVRGRLK